MKKIYATLAGLLAVAVVAFGVAIYPSNTYASTSLDVSSSHVCSSGCTTVTYSHAGGTLTNGAVVIFVGHSSTYTVSSVSYGGVSLVQKTTANFSGIIEDVWVGTGISNGTQTVSVTMSANTSGTGVAIGTLTLNGVDQTTPVDTTAVQNSGHATNMTVSITTGHDSEFVAFYVTAATASASAFTGSTIEFGPLNPTGSGQTSWGGEHTSLVSPAGSVTVGVTAGGSVNYAALAVAFNVPSGGGSSSCTYSGSGDWTIIASDNCYISTDTYVSGKCYLTGTGNIGIAANVSCQGTPAIGAGVNVQLKQGAGSLSSHI